MSDWIVFDYDGTLTTHRSGWTLLHSVFGTEYVQEERLKAYRAGDLTFEEWAELDVQSWANRGANKTDVELAADAVKLSEGIEETFQGLNERGCQFGVLSGGLTQLTTKIQQFGPEFVQANTINFNEDYRIVGVKKQVGPSEKDKVLDELGTEYGFDLDDVTFVGDNNSDIEALQIAGQAILFDPAPMIDDTAYEVADIIIEDHDLAKLLDHI